MPPAPLDLSPWLAEYGERAVAEAWNEARVKATLETPEGRRFGRVLARRFLREARALHSGEAVVKEVADTDPDPGYEADYNPDTDEYVFQFPGRAGALVKSGDAVRQMLVDYTHWDGRAHTMEQVALAHGLTRNEFYGIKKAMGWTKTSLPLTDEEWGHLDEDAAAAKLIALKKRGAERKASAAVWSETKKKAQRWEDFQRGTLRPVAEAVERLVAEYDAPPALRVVPARDERRYALVYMPTDLHVGKRGWSSETGAPDYDLAESRRRLVGATETLLHRLPCRPEKIIACVGGDLLTADTMRGTTTRGTPQDMAATAREMWHHACAITLTGVDLLAQLRVPIEVQVVPGNHDRLTAEALGSVLWAYYREHDLVHVESATQTILGGEDVPGGMHMRVSEYGRNLLCFVHGDGVRKPAELAQLLAHHFPAAWGRTRHRHVFHGHLHHTRVGRQRMRIETADAIVEDGGLWRWCMPSLSGMDAYHAGEGYSTSEPALLGVMLDPDAGWTGAPRITPSMLEPS